MFVPCVTQEHQATVVGFSHYEFCYPPSPSPPLPQNTQVATWQLPGCDFRLLLWTSGKPQNGALSGNLYGTARSAGKASPNLISNAPMFVAWEECQKMFPLTSGSSPPNSPPPILQFWSACQHVFKGFLLLLSVQDSWGV